MRIHCIMCGFPVTEELPEGTDFIGTAFCPGCMVEAMHRWAFPEKYEVVEISLDTTRWDRAFDEATAVVNRWYARPQWHEWLYWNRPEWDQ